MSEKAVFQSEIKSVDRDNLVIEHFISTETADRQKDVMVVDGMYMRGVPAVLKQHGFDPDTGAEPIAKPIEITSGKNGKGVRGIIAKTQYFDGSKLVPPDNTGRRLFEKAAQGFMPYWSIGYRVDEYEQLPEGGRKVTKWELLEYSQVNVPANWEASTVLTKQLAQSAPLDEKSIVRLPTVSVEQKQDKYACECIECGHKMESEKHCKDIKCPKCGGTMRREDRPGPGQKKDLYEMIETYGEVCDPAGPCDLQSKDIKPYPNEHACRLKDPKQFTEFRRTKRKHDKKEYSIIWGKKGDDWIEQAYRYAKDTWEKDDAKKHCDSHGGKFELANEKQMKYIAELVTSPIAANAMYTIFNGAMEALYSSDGSEKIAKSIVKEMGELILPHAITFAAKCRNRGGEESKEYERIHTSIKTVLVVPPSAEQAPEKKTEGQEATSLPEKKTVRVIKSPEPKRKMIDLSEINSLVKSAVSETVRSEFRSLTGKLD